MTMSAQATLLSNPERIQIVYTETVNGQPWKATEIWATSEIPAMAPGYYETIADCQAFMAQRIVEHKASASYQYLLTHVSPGVPSTPVTG